MPYTDVGLPHAGSAELLASMMYDEPAGTLARTIPRGLVRDNTQGVWTTGGLVSVRMIPLPAGLVASKLTVLIGGTGATGPTHFWQAIADAQLNVQQATGDLGAGAQTAGTFIVQSLNGQFVIPYSGLWALLSSSSSSTTAPTAAGMSVASGIAGAAPILCGSAGTLASPPAPGTQLNGGVVTSAAAANIGQWIS